MPCQLDIFSITSSSLDSFCRGCPCSCREGWGRPVGLWSQFVQTQQILTFLWHFLYFIFLKWFLGHLMSFDVIWCHLMSFVSIWNVICLFLATGKWDREAHISPDALRDLQASVSALGTAHVVSASRESRDMSSTSHWSLLKLTETWGPVLAWARRGFKIWVLVDGYQMTARF